LGLLIDRGQAAPASRRLLYVALPCVVACSAGRTSGRFAGPGLPPPLHPRWVPAPCLLMVLLELLRKLQKLWQEMLKI
jgi:hypothetical protein